MRINNPLDDILGNKSHVRVLRHLTRYPSPVITGRGIARELGMSHVSCLRSLNALVDLSVLTRKTVGTSTTYEIPPESTIYSKMLEPLFAEESRLPEGLVKCLLAGIREEIHAAYLFGSVARGEDTPQSDVDILLVLKEGVKKRNIEKRLSDNKYRAYVLYRVGINVVAYGYNECLRKKRQGLPLVREVLSEGRLLAGKEV